MATVPTIQDKAPKPPGLLPKNVQSWLLIGIAVLMVLIMWLTGGKKPVTPSKAAPPSPSVLPPLEVNEAKIVEMQKRIEELQREQSLAQSALAQQSRLLPPLELKRHRKSDSARLRECLPNARKTRSKRSERSVTTFRCLLRMSH